MKKIAVITGASSGIGKEFATRISAYGELDEVWVIARNLQKLEELRSKIPFSLKTISLDLSKNESFEEYEKLLSEEKPFIKLLINCSGFGKFQATEKIPVSENLNMVNLNCAALLAMTQISLKYMGEGSDIIEISSVAAYQPVPYINVYAATKAFVLSFSRGLSREVKSRGIHVMAVCPFWTKTEFFDRAATQDNKAVTYYSVMFTAEEIVAQALKDMKKKKKDTSLHTFKVKLQIFGVKILPHKLVMRVWMRQQKHL